LTVEGKKNLDTALSKSHLFLHLGFGRLSHGEDPQNVPIQVLRGPIADRIGCLKLPSGFQSGGQEAKMGTCFQQDRRVIIERRSGNDRRQFMNLRLNGTERRSHGERRSGYERRRWVRIFLKIGGRPRSPLIEPQVGFRRR
jgi:hypothetical protein